MTRHPLLAGILLAFFLFSAIICTVTTVFLPTIAQNLNIGAAPNRSWTPQPTVTPTFTPVATPGPSTAELPPDLPTPVPGAWQFKPGDIAVNINSGPVNMRRTPGYKNKSPSDRIALIPANARLTILDGPAKADGLIWWFVAWNGQQGWMAEARASGAPMLAKKQ